MGPTAFYAAVKNFSSGNQARPKELSGAGAYLRRLTVRQEAGMSRKRVLRSIGTLLAVVVRQGVATAEPALTSPSNVSAVGSSEHRIEISWRDNSSNETGFEVHRSTDGPTGSYTLLSGTTAQTVSWVDGGLSYSTAYCYKVRAIKIGRGKTSYSAFSAAACATTLPPAVPEAPSNVTAATVSESAITV